MWRWIKKNWKQSLIIATITYAIHIIVEAFVITNVTAALGIKIPVLIPVKTA